jgi:hypothetical protein
MLLELIGTVGVTMVTMFILEVAALLAGSESRRPSVWIGAAAAYVRLGFYYVAYCATLLSDLPRFIKQALLALRDLFFRWIPRAHHDLGAAYKACR